MRKIALLTIGLALTGVAIADNIGKDTVKHMVTLVGLKQGEGRYIRTDLIENGQFKSGYYFCGSVHNLLYADIVYAGEVNDSYRSEKTLKFSICQDETLTQCQEFASDQFTFFKNENGDMETDSKSANHVSVASVKDAFQACEPNPDDIAYLVKKSMRVRG